MKIIARAVIGALLTLPPLVAASRLPEGGGVISPAWTAEYFRNPTLAGAPAYARSEARIDFDWETWRPILGVRAESVRDFPREQISARFRGRIVPRFAEEYTFRLESDEGARLRIRPAGAAEWTTLIDAWEPHARRDDSAQMTLKPDVIYEVELDYFNLTGDAVCRLRWSSPSTPEEVIDYVSGNTVREYWPHMMADLQQMGAGESSGAEGSFGEIDENGWPTGDFSTTLIVGYKFYAGRGLLAFKGQAEVSMDGTFVVGDETFKGTLPKGKGYDAATNETRAFIDFKADAQGLGRSMLTMKKTQRTPDAPVGSGVTDIHVMMPRAAGGKQPHEPGEIVNGGAREAFLPVFAWRVQRTGLNDVVRWSDRTVPTYSKIRGQHNRAELCYEKLILAANELGRDLHLCFSGSCDRDFMVNLAKLFRYGSDGVKPYDKPTPNPVWPPLNPNLRLYLEHGNEMGWSAIQPRQWQRDYEQIRTTKKQPEWGVLNFDGLVDKDPTRGLFRYHAYRTVMMSDAMREVWGDAAINDRIRVMIFGQYERDFQNTFIQFLDDYYNNGAGQFVAQPRAPREILYASGPAVYYGTTNMWAVGDKEILGDGGFEGYDVAPGRAVLTPAGGAWTFTGQAGVVDDRYPRHEAFAAPAAASSAPYAVPADGAVGTQITVGPRDLYVYEAGRHFAPGEKGPRSVNIFALDGSRVGTGRAPALKADGPSVVFGPLEYDAWITSDSSRVGLWRLEAGRSYLVLSAESKGAKVAAPTALTAGPGLRLDGAVFVPGFDVANKKGGVAPALERLSGEGTGFPLATLRYTDVTAEPVPGSVIVPPDPKVDPTWASGGKGKSFVPPPHRTGTRAAFIAGPGRISQRFSVDRPDEYALVFTAASGARGENPLTITMDGTTVWDRAPVGSGRKPATGVFQWGTRYLRLEPGEHELVIEGTAKDPAATVYLLTTHVGAMSDYAGGETAKNFLGAGAATGQTDSAFARNAQICTLMAQNWGLVPYAYEGGTNPGGDWNGGGVLYTTQFKWDHPVARVADNQWAAFWHKFGGRNAMYYYPGFADDGIAWSARYQPWKAADERAGRWSLEPGAGIVLPAKLTATDPHSQGRIASNHAGWAHPINMKEPTPRLEPGQWKSWIVRAPEARRYRVTLASSAGGTARLAVDDTEGLVTGASGQPLETSVHLTRGLHAIKVRCNDGAFEVQGIEVR